MTARLRIVLDQLVSPTDSDLAAASRSLAQALIEAAPSGCDVAGMLTGGDEAAEGSSSLPGLADVWRARVGRRELAQVWRWGVPLGAGRGMIHSPTLMAPLVRHDRVHDHDQTVVTLWSLEAWLTPERLPRGEAAWQRAMLSRAVRHADAVVVPTHAMASQLAEIAPLGSRIRVIAGAPPEGFAVTPDAPGRVRTLGLSQPYVVVAGPLPEAAELRPLISVAADLDLDVVVLGALEADAASGADRWLTDRTSAPHIHVLTSIDAVDRAAVLAGAVVAVAPSTVPAFPWQMLEALAVGVPIVAVTSVQNEELLADAAVVASDGDLAPRLHTALTDEAALRRMSVLSADRSRAFSWRDAAQRVWQLHAEL